MKKTVLVNIRFIDEATSDQNIFRLENLYNLSIGITVNHKLKKSSRFRND